MNTEREVRWSSWFEGARLIGVGRDDFLLTSLRPAKEHGGLSLTSPKGNRTVHYPTAAAGCMSAQGQLVARAGQGECVISDCELDEELARFALSSDRVDLHHPCFIPDGSGVAFGEWCYAWDGTPSKRGVSIPDIRVRGARKSTKVMCVSTGEVLMEVPEETYYARVRFDGRYVALVLREGLRIFELGADARCVLDSQVPLVGSAAFGADGSLAYARPTEREVILHPQLLDPIANAEEFDESVIETLRALTPMRPAARAAASPDDGDRGGDTNGDLRMALTGLVRPAVLSELLIRAERDEGVRQLCEALVEADSLKDLEESSEMLVEMTGLEPPIVDASVYEELFG